MMCQLSKAEEAILAQWLKELLSILQASLFRKRQSPGQAVIPCLKVDGEEISQFRGISVIHMFAYLAFLFFCYEK